MPRKRGYTRREAEQICAGLAEGKSLLRLLRENRDLPRNSTIMRWLNEQDEFRQMYVQARKFQAEMLFDEIREIADHENAAEPWRAQLRVSSRKWMVGRMHPKKFGENPCRRWGPEAAGPTVIEVVTGIPNDQDGAEEG